MRISDWSSDVCSADLAAQDEDSSKRPIDHPRKGVIRRGGEAKRRHRDEAGADRIDHRHVGGKPEPRHDQEAAADPEKAREDAGAKAVAQHLALVLSVALCSGRAARLAPAQHRSEEHTSELQSLMRISYAVFFFKNKTTILFLHLNFTFFIFFF